MSIVSMSLPDDLVRDMDHAIAHLGYKGRSEFLRAAVRDHLQNRHDALHRAVPATALQVAKNRVAPARSAVASGHVHDRQVPTDRAAGARDVAGAGQRVHVHGSITIVYPHGKEARVSEVRHAFHDVVLSLMHTHCEETTCMDVLIVGGPAARVQELAQVYERLRDVTRSRLVVMA